MPLPLTLTIAADHPALPGHFPDGAIVPGVVILDTVLAAIAHEQPQLIFAGLRKVKFLQPLYPGQTFTLHYSPPFNGRVKISCLLAATPLLEATGVFEPAANLSIER